MNDSTQSATDNYKGVWDNRVGFGTTPALVVIDFMKGYTTEGSPLFAPGVVDAVKGKPGGHRRGSGQRGSGAAHQRAL